LVGFESRGEGFEKDNVFDPTKNETPDRPAHSLVTMSTAIYRRLPEEVFKILFNFMYKAMYAVSIVMSSCLYPSTTSKPVLPFIWRQHVFRTSAFIHLPTGHHLPESLKRHSYKILKSVLLNKFLWSVYETHDTRTPSIFYLVHPYEHG
jgi:hypothetical protein